MSFFSRKCKFLILLIFCLGILLTSIEPISQENPDITSFSKKGSKLGNILSTPANSYMNFSYSELPGFDDDGSPMSVFVVGNRLYLADGDLGLKIFDISDISNPIELGSFFDGSGNAKDVIVIGNYAYVADGDDGLEIINIVNPASPYKVGQYISYYSAEALKIYQNHAYIADDGYALVIVNIADPSNPYEEGYYSDTYGGLDLAISYPYVYVAHNFGFFVLDVSDPTNIVKSDEYKPYGTGGRIECIGTDVFFYDTHFDSLSVFDASNANSIILKDQFPIIMEEFTLFGDYAYCINNRNISIVNISNRSEIFIATNYLQTQGSYNVDVQKCLITNNVLYITDYYGGVNLLSIASPESPSFICQIFDGGTPHTFQVQNDILFVSEYASRGIEILNISNPTEITEIAQFYTTYGNQNFEILEEFMFCGYYNGTVETYNIADLQNIYKVGESVTQYGVHDFLVINDTLFSCGYSFELAIYNISDPNNFILYDSYADTDMGHGWSLDIEGDFAYVADYAYGVKAFNISDYNDIRKTATRDYEGLYENVEVIDGTLYVGKHMQFEVFDVSNPPSISLLDSIDGGYFSQMYIDNDLAFFSGIDEVFKIVNISDPSNLSMVGKLSEEYPYGRDIIVQNSTIFVSSLYTGIRVFEYSIEYFTNLSPIVSHPGDYQLYDNLVNYNITWHIEDDRSHNGTFSIYQNSSEVETGIWENNTDVFHTLTSLSQGIYNYTIYLFDGMDGYSQDSVTITILENPPPSLINSSDFAIFLDLQENKNLTWIPSDSVLLDATYNITLDGILVDEGNWASETNITLNLNGYSIGEYEFILNLDDGLGWTTQEARTVIINDLPNIDSPSELQYYEGQSGNSLQWGILDNCILLGTYNITKEGTLIDSGEWINNSIIELAVNGLSTGNHTYTLSIFDGYNGYAESKVNVTVLPNLNPEFSLHPADLVTNGILHQITLEWLPFDGSVEFPTYNITCNGSLLKTGLWNSGEIINITLDDFAIGNWQFLCTIDDGLGGIVSDEVSLIVNDFPIIHAQEAQIIYLEGDSRDYNVSWYLLDELVDVGRYNITKDGILVESGNWENGSSIEYPVNGLAQGEYNFTLWIYDGYNAYCNNSVIVNVTNNLAPFFIMIPGNLILLENHTLLSVNWTIVDETVLSPSYTIDINGEFYNSGAWESGTNITALITDLSIGIWEFNLTIYDGLGEFITQSSRIIINDLPQITSEGEFEFIQGSTGNRLLWTINDSLNESLSVQISINGSNIIDTPVLVGGKVEISIDDLDIGLNIVMLSVDDGYGGIVSKSVNVYVYPNDIPILNAPEDREYLVGFSDYSIDWIVMDGLYSTSTYDIYQNSTLIKSGTWNSADVIQVSLIDLNAGIYFYRIEIDDGFAGRATDEIKIEIVENRNPVVNSPENMEIVGDTSNYFIQWNVTDQYTSMPSYCVYQNNSLIQNGIWSNGDVIQVWLEELDEGQYLFTLELDDGLGGFCEDSVLVIVLNSEDTDETSSEGTKPDPLPNGKSIPGLSLHFLMASALFAIIPIIVFQKMQNRTKR